MNNYKELNDYYDAQFYQSITEDSLYSAKAILSILYKSYQPLSVVDIGCGMGSWLAAAESFGSRKLKGFDGRWVNKDNFLSNNIDFTAVDIAKDGLELKEKYDLCISVEVAEHLPEASSNRFIQTLCKASDVIIFSAAIKCQGGTSHINEQWQSYWIKLFDANGYRCFDIFRPIVWENKKVGLWYRQNIFLFVSQAADLENFNNLQNTAISIANIVHPEYYLNKCANYGKLHNKIQYPSIRFCLSCIMRYFLNKLHFLSAKFLLGKNRQKVNK